MARPAPGSLAARTELRNPLSLFKKSGGRGQLSKGAGGGSVGEVTIEIDPDDNADGGGGGGGGRGGRPTRAPAKASPLVDYDSGPSASPSLTISPTSSPVPAPSTPQHPSPLVTVTGLPLASEEPSPKSEGTTATVGGGIGGGGSHVENSATPVSTEANVVLRRQSGSAPKTPLPPYVNLSASSSDDLKRHIIRNSRRNKQTSLGGGGGNGEVGKLLKAALNDYFERKKNGQTNGSPALDSYVAEVFGALDYHKRGTVSREDFDTLCEVIGISPSPPPSHRNSGLEWLSSYRPRPTSPAAAASPIRVDRLGEVKYRRPIYEPRPEPPSSFLFTLGPRPFWELWPQKKRKRKRLTVDDFKKCLLEQWAKNRGIPQSRISTVLPVHFTLPTVAQVRKVNVEDRIDSARAHGGIRNGVQFAAHSASEDSKSKKAMRRLVRVTRKYQALDRISEKLEDRLQRGGGGGRRVNFVRNGSLHAANPRPCPIHSNQAASSSSSLAGRSWSLRHRRRRRRPVVICSPHCPDLGGSDGGEEQPPVYNGRERVRRIESLEEQLRFQEAEISTLKDEVDGLRSSLQISDAQNLALQVLLRKVARGGGEGGGSGGGADTPTTTTANGTVIKGNGSSRLNGTVSAMSEEPVDPFFRQRKDDNETQLENLVKELKEMSKIRYPNIGTKQQSSSSNNSCNGATEDDFGMTSPLPPPPPPPGTGRFPATFQFRTGPKASKGEDTVDDGGRDQMDVAEAYRALERAQEELNKMR